MSESHNTEATEGTAEYLDPQLGYVWQDPPSPRPTSFQDSVWRAPSTGPFIRMTEALVAQQWRVADLRDEIAALGISPKGRTRAQLAEQLSRAFLDPERLSKALDSLTETARQQYTRLLLQFYFNRRHAYPVRKALWQGVATSSRELMVHLHRANLVLDAGEGQAYIPHTICSQLPPLHITLPTAADPSSYVPGADPHGLLTQIQQMLYVLQSETLRLSPVLMWQAPSYAYAQTPVCWPPTPVDAKALYANAERERMIELLPPEYSLDETALELGTEALGVSQNRLEFLYRLLVAGGMVWEGSPLTVHADAVQAWLTASPGRQLAAVYQLYSRAITHWAVWWPQWRAGTITLRQAYHGYWGLVSLEDTVRDSTRALRGVLLEALSFLPDGRWIGLGTLTHWLQELFPTTEGIRHLMGLRPEHADGGWPAFLQTLVLEMLTGPLHTLGLVDIGPSLEDVRVLRLHGLQDLHWGRVLEVDLGAAAQLPCGSVRFDAAEACLEIETPVPPDFLAFVLSWTKPAGYSKSRARYGLDLAQLYKAFEEGADLQTLARDWQSSVGSDPLPGVLTWWQYWWRRYGRVRVYAPQAMLQTRDALTMQELQLALPSLDRAVASMLTPETVLLKPEAVDQLMEDLSRQGYMPKKVVE